MVFSIPIMVLENLGAKLKETLSKVTGALFVDEKLVNELVKDIQKALLSADVNVKLVFDLTKTIKERALSEEAPGSIPKKDWLVKIVYEELAHFLGEDEFKLDIIKKPTKIMLVGLFGSGKTTTAGKLAKYFQKRGLRVALVGTDTWRPAALTQLEQIGHSISVPVFGDPHKKDPANIYSSFENKLADYDVVIIDSAGRDALSENLIKELQRLDAAVKPDYSMLVLSADVGQAAQRQAQAFHDACNVKGVIITKLDGTAKGGGALIACSVTGAKVAFIGVGEKIDDLEKFKPKNFVGRMLGMGDIEALLEKARHAISEEEARDITKRVLKGEFTLIDLYDQMQAMKKMGPISKVMEMIPGLGSLSIPKEALQVQQEKLERWKFIMDSCTKEELEEPEIISGPRVERIAKGSGSSVKDVRDLLKQHKQAKKMVKMLKGGNMKNMEKMVQRMGAGKFKLR